MKETTEVQIDLAFEIYNLCSASGLTIGELIDVLSNVMGTVIAEIDSCGEEDLKIIIDRIRSILTEHVRVAEAN